MHFALVVILSQGAAWGEEAKSPPRAAAAPSSAADGLRELLDFSYAGLDRRLGPAYDHYHRGTKEAFPTVYLAPRKQDKGGRPYQIGGPWNKGNAGDYSSTQGQVLYGGPRGFGVDRVTIIEWAHGCWTESPEPPWWGGFRPEPAAKAWNARGTPLAMARGMGGWSNLGLIVFSSGLVATAGTATAAGNNATFRFPPDKIPTAISVTNRNEFALVTIYDSRRQQGQVAVLALVGSGKASGFAHEWPDDYPCLPNVAIITGIKLLGYVELPDLKYPSSISAVGNRMGGRVNGADGHAGLLRNFNLDDAAARRSFATGSNAAYCSNAGFAIVASKSEGQVALLDLEPLFAYVRQMYFDSQESYQQTRNLGAAADQWPYTFAHEPKWQPTVVKTLAIERPTAVLASLSGGDKALAYAASEKGELHVLGVGGLATPGAAIADDVTRLHTLAIGANPTCLAYQKGSRDTLIAVCRGDREIQWIKASRQEAQIIRRLRDARLIDPVYVEMADTHGIEAGLITVADFGGRKILNYRWTAVKFATQGGAVYGMGPQGKDEFECGGILEFPGSPFCISATNVN
ncbi:MAG: hypothetical protein WD042_03095 [Phycisphaeraceae bacterium]